MWYLVYEDYEDFFFGKEPPVKVPKKFKNFEEIEKFAKEHSMELKRLNNSCELYIKSPSEYTARYELHEENSN